LRTEKKSSKSRGQAEKKPGDQHSRCGGPPTKEKEKAKKTENQHVGTSASKKNKVGEEQEAERDELKQRKFAGAPLASPGEKKDTYVPRSHR